MHLGFSSGNDSGLLSRNNWHCNLLIDAKRAPKNQTVIKLIKYLQTKNSLKRDKLLSNFLICSLFIWVPDN